MALIGYARVSTSDQDLTIQREALKAAGCNPIREEKVSGTSTTGRKELATIRALIGKGDTLVVTRIDRLARSVADLATIVRELHDKGAALKVLEQAVDTGSSSGKAFLNVLATFAEFEADIRQERQMEGIAKAKAAGVYKGGKRRIDRDQVRTMHAAGQGPAAIAKALGCSRMQVYRVISDRAPENLKGPVASVETATSRPKVERVRMLTKPPVEGAPKVAKPQTLQPGEPSPAGERPRASKRRVRAS